MHLLILGLILVVGIFAYYIITTSPGNGKSSDAGKPKIKLKKDEPESHVPDDLRKEGNVVFLPSAGKDADASGRSEITPDISEDASDRSADTPSRSEDAPDRSEDTPDSES